MLENMISLMGDNIEGDGKGSVFDNLLTRLQFINDNGVGEKTLVSISDVFELLDSSAADNVSEVARDNDITDFGNVNRENSRRDFR